MGTTAVVVLNQSSFGSWENKTQVPSTSLYVRAARYCADMYFSSERPSEAWAQLMGETLIVSSFAKLFCDQFAHSVSLCLRSLPLYRAPPPPWNGCKWELQISQIWGVREWAERLPLVASTATRVLKITNDIVQNNCLSVIKFSEHSRCTVISKW